MSIAERYAPVQAGEDMVHALRRLGLTNRQSVSVILSTLGAIAAELSEERKTELQWLDRAGSSAMAVLIKSELRGINITSSPGSIHDTAQGYQHATGWEITIGDAISISGTPGVEWEVLDVAECMKHPPSTPSHAALRITGEYAPADWVCSLDAKKIEKLADDQTQ